MRQEMLVSIAKILTALASFSTCANAIADDGPSLKEAVGQRFLMGVGVGHLPLEQADDLRLIKKHFQVVTPENCMKPQFIQPVEKDFRFADTDRFVAVARANKLDVVGHCLIWAKDDRTSPWMLTEDDRPVSAKKLLQRIEDHVHTVVARYEGDVSSWDVVNEALADGGDQVLRDSVYTRLTGDEFIANAFVAARVAAPTAVLIYNDYDCHLPHKRKKLLSLLKSLKDQGVPVDAVGMQGHFELGDRSVEQLRETLQEFRQLHLKVVISELDIDVIPRSRWWAENGKFREELSRFDPYRDGCPAAILEQEARQYAELFALFDRYQDIILRVSFWNLHDGQSWLNDFPWKRVNYPLLFDRNRQPKPAFDAVIKLLQTDNSK